MSADRRQAGVLVGERYRRAGYGAATIPNRSADPSLESLPVAVLSDGKKNPDETHDEHKATHHLSALPPIEAFDPVLRGATCKPGTVAADAAATGDGRRFISAFAGTARSFGGRLCHTKM